MKQGFSDYYEANLSLLKKYHPHVWEMMTDQDVTPRGEIVLSGGKPNLKLADAQGRAVYCHDSIDPEAEVPSFLNMVPASSMGVVALVGMGLGYTPLALLRERPNLRYLVAFEADPGIFLQALEHMDLSSMLSDSRLILAIGKEPDVERVLAPASLVLRLEPAHMLKHLPMFTLENQVYQRLYDLVFAYANQLNIGAATTLKFGNDFINNRFVHLTSIHHSCLLESLREKFAGIPAIMVAGGPSLDKNIHLLKEAKGKAVILAVDTVLPTLLKRNIIPDFVTSIDPQEMTYEKFADVVPQVEGVPYLICSAWAHPKIPKVFPADRVFWSFSGNPIEKWLNSLMGGSIHSGGAGTVAHMNMIAAVIMGCSPIVFTGQDLAYTDSKDHAGDVALTSRKQMEELLASRDMITVDGINGEKVATSRGFLTHKTTFEQMIEKNPGHYINATEGGVHIKGTEAVPLREVLDTYCKNRQGISFRVKNCAMGADLIDPKAMLAEFRFVNKTVTKLRKLIKKADALGRRVQHELKKCRKNKGRYRSFDTLPKSMQKQIAEIDSCHSKIDKEDKVWKLLEDITMEGLKQSERLKQKAALCKDDPARYLEWLSLSMERLELINRVRIEVLDLLEGNIDTVLEFHEKETKLIGKLETEENNKQKNVELARVYVDTGNYMLARRLLENFDLSKMASATPDSAELYFYLGVIAAYQTDYEKSERFFEKAVDDDFEFAEQIRAFQFEMGNQYLAFADKKSASGEKNIVIRMLLKGVRYNSDHKVIKTKLVSYFNEDLKEVQEHLKTDSIARIDSILAFWRAPLENNPHLPKILNADQKADYYKYQGMLFTAKKDFSGAFESFSKALAYTPQNPDLHVLLTDVLFAQNKFDEGIKHLNIAVAKDRNYAVYWENIGDNLQNEGLLTDAIAAYEQWFTASPEHFIALKKMGDCYTKLGNLDAAYEAYQQFKKMIELG